jgi:NADH-quinone oxidoreductase subunit L
MLDYLWLVPALPFGGFVILLFLGERFPRWLAALVGVGSVGLSAVIGGLITYEFILSPPEGHAFSQVLWTWVAVGDFQPRIAFYLDALALVMVLVVTWVGFLIHLYSVEYMGSDEDFVRFFACMNLFVFAMLVLVLGDNLLLLYVGWEGVGLCSYLLIGFWHKEPDNCTAAQKAFIVTRVGDMAMTIGFLVLVLQLGTLDLQDLMQRAQTQWGSASGYVTVTTLLLLGGAVGKSAQLPLQTWLPDAMAGPTPVSALIHAATMVTAGVYLIARTHVLFLLSPTAMSVVAVVGCLTLLVAGFSALVQTDIKRVLAYSTISQIGYMFLALGVGAWSAAMFHFMTHAFFKALLFLAAGGVIHALHNEQNIFKMGGLWKQLPVVFWTFLVGAGCLAGIPLITSGFYSKDAVLWAAFSSEHGSFLLWFGAWIGAVMTSIYTFRLVFVAFFGEAKNHVHHRPGAILLLPLVVLALLSFSAGFIELPHNMGHVQLFSNILDTAFHSSEVEHPGEHAGGAIEGFFQVLAGIGSLSGAAIAWWVFLRRPSLARSLATSPAGSRLQAFWMSGWGFDNLYDRLFVRPFLWLSDFNRDDVVDGFYTLLAEITQVSHAILSLSQTGRLRWYAAWVAAGSVGILGMLTCR